MTRLTGGEDSLAMTASCRRRRMDRVCGLGLGDLARRHRGLVVGVAGQ